MFKANPLKLIPKASVVAVAALMLVACDSDDNNNAGNTSATTYIVPLTSANEVPPVVLPAAHGEGNIVVDSSTGAISGSVSVSGLTGTATMAHIHQAPDGENGPVVLGLEGNADGSVWSVPADSVLDTPQLQALLAGDMYFNVHTEANPAGELRGQIRETTEFTVRIDNISTGETLPTSAGPVAVPLSPGAYIVHRADRNPLLDPRSPASTALEQVAEDGNPALFPTTIPGSVVFNTPVGATEPGPLFPGDYYSFSFRAAPGDSLGFVTMFVQSNDWFYTATDDNNDSLPLFDESGAAFSGVVDSSLITLWESETEVDEEPGTGPNQAPRQSGPNTGASETGSVGSIAGKGKSVTLNGGVIRMTITPN